MPIKLYASTVVRAAPKDEDDLADDELAKMSAGQEPDQFDLEADSSEDLEEESSEEDEVGFLDEDEDEEEDEEESVEADVFDLLAAFFKLNPSPDDEQFHALALSIGMAPEELEAKVYKVMSIMMDNDDSKEAVEDAVDEAAEDDLSVESDVEPYNPAEAEEDGAPDLDTLPENASTRLRYSLSRR